MSKRKIWIIEAVSAKQSVPLPDEAKLTKREALERAKFLAQYGFIPVKFQATCYVPRSTPKPAKRSPGFVPVKDPVTGERIYRKAASKPKRKGRK